MFIIIPRNMDTLKVEKILLILSALLIIANLIIILCQGIYNFIDNIKLNKKRDKLDKLMEETLEKINADIENTKSDEEE